jgi:hypothetical protein
MLSPFSRLRCVPERQWMLRDFRFRETSSIQQMPEFGAGLIWLDPGDPIAGKRKMGLWITAHLFRERSRSCLRMVKLRLLFTLSLTQRASMPISSCRDTETFVFLRAVRFRAVARLIARLIDRLAIVKLMLVQHHEHDLIKWLADKIDQ